MGNRGLRFQNRVKRPRSLVSLNMLCCEFLLRVLISVTSIFSVVSCLEGSTSLSTVISSNEKNGHEPRTILIISEAGLEPLNDPHPSLVPRGGNQASPAAIPDKWRQSVEQAMTSGRLPIGKVDPNEIPGIFQKIYSQCMSSVNGQPSDKQLTQCIVNEAIETLPAKPYVKNVARAVVSDLINKKGQGFYTTKSVLEASALCSERTQEGVVSQQELSKCFFNLLTQLHPLKDLAVPALKKTRAYGFFQNVAKTCHDAMPKTVTTRRDINRYYLQCFIDTASARYENNLLVKYGRNWLTYYIDHPDSVFNRERIIEIAESCQDRTSSLPANKRKSAAFVCFFRSLLSLHPRTKWLAENLRRWEAAHPQKADGDKTLSSGESQTSERQSRSIMPMLSRSGSGSLGRESIKDCMMRAVTTLPIAQQILGSVTGLTGAVGSVMGRFPKVGSLFGRSLSSLTSLTSSAADETTLRKFVDAATPCFRFFKRDESGKLVLDQEYAAATALDLAKMNPSGRFAIGAAEALAENVSVTTDKEGKSQYDINYKGLGTALLKAAVNSTPAGKALSKYSALL